MRRTKEAEPFLFPEMEGGDEKLNEGKPLLSRETKIKTPN